MPHHYELKGVSKNDPSLPPRIVGQPLRAALTLPPNRSVRMAPDCPDGAKNTMPEVLLSSVAQPAGPLSTWSTPGASNGPNAVLAQAWRNPVCPVRLLQVLHRTEPTLDLVRVLTGIRRPPGST